MLGITAHHTRIRNSPYHFRVIASFHLTYLPIYVPSCHFTLSLSVCLSYIAERCVPLSAKPRVMIFRVCDEGFDALRALVGKSG